MGWFSSGSGPAKKDGLPSLALMHQLQCKICPLDKLKNRNPHIPAKGAKHPLIYMLGEAPGAEEDSEAGHFIGKSGMLLRRRLPKEVLPHLRWNNVVRTRPKANATPERLEVECCRPSVALDIAASKPRAIFGFGNIALQWATSQIGIQKWRGRKTPVEINGHAAWFYPMLHPAALLRMGRRVKNDLGPTEIGSEEERAFTFDLQRALDEVEYLPEPKVLTPADLKAGLELLTRLDQIESALLWAADQQVIGLDYETFRMRPYAEDAQVLTAAIGTERRSFAFAFDHPGQKWSKHDRAKLNEIWRDFLMSQTRKAVHNLPFEQEWSGVFYGADVLRAGPWECTYQQAAALDDRIGASESNEDKYRRGGGSLDFLIRQHFGVDLKKLSPLNKKDLRSEPLADVLVYNGMDAKGHYLLWREQD
ncbi:MAG TPA: uracil-DNA glycosylase family protein, partial [Rhizomicrobium sp.]